MLKIHDLHVSYGGIQALRGIDLEVPDGKIVTLIGANGAGKSTTLRTISGLVKAESGSVTYDGVELLGKPIYKILEMGIAMVPEGRRILTNLTVLENLRIGAYLRRDRAAIEQDIRWVYSLFPRLEERSWQLGGTLSGGEQQMLAVGRALMSRPKLMMMDEPSLGLAPLVVRDIFNIIREINRQGVTVLLIEQNANMALKTADIGYVLETGRAKSLSRRINRSLRGRFCGPCFISQKAFDNSFATVYNNAKASTCFAAVVSGFMLHERRGHSGGHIHCSAYRESLPLPRPSPKSKPNAVGSILRGKRKERIWSFRHTCRKRNGASFV